MTATRDTLASLDGRLDDFRREYAWRAIARKLEATEFRERRRSRRWWLWLLVPATAMAAAAAALGLTLLTPIEWRNAPKPPPLAPYVGRGANPPQERVVPVVESTPVESPVAPSAPTAAPPVHGRSKPQAAAVLYRRAESALAAQDPKSARASLELLLRTYPRDALADPARYDLALIAHNGGDDATAIALLDQILSGGSDANVQLAAASLRRMLVAR